MKAVDVTDIPELLSIVEEMCNTGEPRVLRRGSDDIAILTPISPKPARAAARVGTTPHDTILDLIGISESAEPTDISRHKRQYLAEAYEPKHP